MKENYVLYLIVPTLGILASVITASLSYYFAKIQQIRNDSRKLKEEYYRNFIKAVSDVAIDNMNPDAQRMLSEGFNILTLVGNKEVVEKLMLFYQVTTKKFSQEMGEDYLPKYDRRLRDLIIEMRRDLFGNKTREDDFPVIHLVGRARMES